eukprot:45210-Amphidinium_carterae.1
MLLLQVVAKLPSSEFQKICKDLKEFGETMQVKASKEGITFSVQAGLATVETPLLTRRTTTGYVLLFSPQFLHKRFVQ